MVGTPRRAAFILWDLTFGSAAGVLAGLGSALFLRLLEGTLVLRGRHPWLLLGLPLFGLVSAWLYRAFGKDAEGGGSLVLDEVLEFKGRVPSRMAPLVLAGSLLSHLGGASVGREGVAVQMGASLARTLGKLPWAWLRLTASRQRLLLMAGISGGFGSLFGTPLAGALFGMEAIAIGRIHYEGLVICTAASVSGDLVCRALGVHHGRFLASPLALDGPLALNLLLFALPVALVAGLFSEAAHGLAKRTAAWFGSRWYLRPLAGGLVFLALHLIFPEDAYLNLGLPWLDRIFGGAPVPAFAFALKALFTCVALGFGFKGGEVTPLFVIGALLGAATAPLLGLPPAFLAAVGLVALFAAASNTPLASMVLGAELFGAPFLLPVALAAFPAYILVGHRGIYGGHRVGTSKEG